MTSDESLFLSQLEQDILREFYENVPLREAVKKVLLAPLYGQGVLKPGEPAEPLQNAIFTAMFKLQDASNEVKGAKVSAMYEGILLVEAGFEKLAQFKKVEPEQPKVNRAR
jgi:hypothetical protein